MFTFISSGAAALAVAVVMAVPAAAEDRVPVTARVSMADINLSAPGARALLEARVRRVAKIACYQISPDQHDRADSQQCRNEMMASSRTQIAAVSRPAATQIALNTIRR